MRAWLNECFSALDRLFDEDFFRIWMFDDF